jgi:release factor glutamine methyltransferase
MMHAMPTVDDVLRDAERILKRSTAMDHPHEGKERWDARVLLDFVLGRTGEDEDEVPTSALPRFHRLLARRAAGEPPAYLTGTVEFLGLDLRVGRGAFIPRESSEFMARQAIRRLRGRRQPIHIDLATGVGPVALAVASAVPEVRVFGVDLYSRPVALARGNAKRLGLANATFLRGDLFAPLPRSLRGSVDVITLHPPYVPRNEVRNLALEIRAFEPTESLTDDSPDGKGLLGRAAEQAADWLRPGGWLLVEVSPDFSRVTSTVLRRAGLRDVRSTKDRLAISRVVVGRP